MTQSERRRFLIHALLQENAESTGLAIPGDEAGQRALLRALMNLRPAGRAAPEFLQVQDAYLRAETTRKGIVDADALPEAAPGLALWQGDITALRCDAIVNAANSGLTGCYLPNHRCIDNCIHTYAGVQLRRDCAALMQAQGAPEPTGQARITPAYNLPCRYVLHTVGPIVTGRVTARDRAQLAACYRACLALAAENGLHSVAFCCISTGEFHFPNEEAARIALSAVRSWLPGQTTVRKVIFNVFKDLDREIYAGLLGVD